MKDYSEMSDFEVNKAVGYICGIKWAELDKNYHPLSCWKDGDLCVFFPCNSWADAGPIISANRISLMFDRSTEEGNEAEWCLASSPDDQIIVDYVSSDKLLRAAIIVFLMMQESK